LPGSGWWCIKGGSRERERNQVVIGSLIQEVLFKEKWSLERRGSNQRAGNKKMFGKRIEPATFNLEGKIKIMFRKRIEPATLIWKGK
jgi:hypothetical protein